MNASHVTFTALLAAFDQGKPMDNTAVGVNP